MIVAIVALACLLTFQFAEAMECECKGLAFVYAAEIVLFAFVVHGIKF